MHGFFICVTLLLAVDTSLAAKKAFIDPADPSQGFCKPGLKKHENGTCIQITNNDILTSLHWLSSPPVAPVCKKMTVVQNIAVCEDYLPILDTNTDTNDECVIFSVVSTIFCDFYGSLEFEKYWSHYSPAILFLILLD